MRSNDAKKGLVVWITGLSGSGKTTLASNLINRLREKNYSNLIFLDGDQLREVFGSQNNFDRDSRIRIALQYSRLSGMLASQGLIVITSTISMFKEIYAYNRKNISQYYEVYLRTPIDELKKRDSKKIYSRFASGEISNVAGLDLKVDQPNNPNLTVDFDSSIPVVKIADKLILDLKL